MYKYDARENELREQASIPETEEDYLDEVYQSSAYSERGFRRPRTITCSPQCRDVWKDQQSVKEGEFEERAIDRQGRIKLYLQKYGNKNLNDFGPEKGHMEVQSVSHQLDSRLNKAGIPSQLAYPIQQEESEDEWSEAWKIIVDILYDKDQRFNATKIIDRLKQHFTIHRKQ